VPGHTLTLADKQEVTRELLACGATIHDVNRVRKKLSAIKGGRLAQAIAPAHCLSLILSDVVGDDLDVIASGPTVPDSGTPAEALATLDRYELAGRIPATVMALLRDVAAGLAPDTPKADDPAFATTRTVLVGTNYQALLAARDKAVALGYNTLILTSHLTGEAREMAHLFLGMARDMALHGQPLAPPACVIAGGETTVTLRGPGKGGRNQEMALAFLDALSQGVSDAAGTVFLAASTDGGDGPTDAAWRLRISGHPAPRPGNWAWNRPASWPPTTPTTILRPSTSCSSPAPPIPTSAISRSCCHPRPQQGFGHGHECIFVGVLVRFSWSACSYRPCCISCAAVACVVG